MDEIIELLKALGLEPTQENIRSITSNQAANARYFTQERTDPVARDREAQAGLRRQRAAEVRARPGQVLNTLGEQSLGRLLTGLAPAPGTETEAEQRVLGPVADVTPVVGDIKGVMEGYSLAREGHPFLGGGIALASAIPFVPFPAGAAARHLAGKLEAAVRIGDDVYTGVNHGDAAMKAARATGMSVEEVQRVGDIDGFVTPEGQYMNRARADEAVGVRTSEENIASRPTGMADQNRAISEATAKNQGATFSTDGEDLFGSDNFVTAIRPGDDKVVPAMSGGTISNAHLNQFREEFAEELANPNNNIGTWRRAATEEEIAAGLAGRDGEVVVLDVARTYPRTEEGYRQALDIAGVNEQDAIFDLNVGEEIRLRDADTKQPVEPPSFSDWQARFADQGESQTPTLDAMSDEQVQAGLAEVQERSRTSRRGGGADRRQEQVPFEGPDQRTGDRRQSASPEIDEAEEALRRFVTGEIETQRAAGGDLGGLPGGGDPAAGEAAIRERLIGQIEEARSRTGVNEPFVPPLGRGPPEGLLAPTELAGAPAFTPTELAYSDPTYGIFDPDAPPLEATRGADPEYLAAQGEFTGKMHPMIEAMQRSQTLRRGLDADVIAGMELLSGRPWYELGGLRQLAGEIEGSDELFRNFNIIGAAASAQNSVPNELSLSSIINYGQRNNLFGRPEALEAFERFTGSQLPLNDASHFARAQRGVNQGTLLPATLREGNWKTPSYLQARLGAQDAMATLDTHERRRLFQLVMANPNLRRLAMDPELGWTAAQRAPGAIPIRNALDYQGLSRIYEEGAQRFGLPSAAAYQAPRWTGGGSLTGLDSPPNRTFQEILADQTLFTAQQRGLDESPYGLRRLLGGVLQGNEFLLPWHRKGPLPLRGINR